MTQETRHFDTETSKIFKMMIHSLYENKDIFLRELVSNASDACDKLRYRCVSEDGLMSEGESFKIQIVPDKQAKTLTIIDNGVGMSRDDLIENLGTIARSGTERFAKELDEGAQSASQLIGQFGVGFYSAFMVADKVTVISQAAGEKQAYQWESNGEDAYTIEESDEQLGHGTKVVLHIKDEEKNFLEFFRLNHILQTYSSHIAFETTLYNEEEATEKVVNDGSAALWRKNKSEISNEEYEEFYHTISHMPNDTPWMTLHNHAEGMIEYRNLLFIPSRKPFDLHHPDRETQIKLYIKRVFIAEKLDILPPYLRFVKGVIDSEDLPLNVSRETVQNNAALQKIKHSVTKKILSELNKKSKKDTESYAEFWQNFGAVLKEGLCETTAPREEILTACRFYSTESQECDVSLSDYVSRMKENQNTIFYIIGDDYNSIANSPQLEGFKKRGIEVLLLTDSVDDFWVNVVPDFENKSLQSVTRGDYDLDEIVSVKDKKEKATKEEPKEQQDHGTLIAFFKTALADIVKDVRITSKLAESPVCLAASDGAMDIRLERFMVENKQMAGASAKVLEINPEHNIIKYIASHCTDDSRTAELSDLAHLLFAQANIIEGEPVNDVNEFTRRMNSFLQGAIKAA